MKKELRPVHDVVNCDVCGRTILKGERVEWYLAPGGQRHQVCDLCAVRAQHHGWIRESAAGETPTRVPRHEPRRGVLGRLKRRRAPDPPEPHGSQDGEAPPPEHGASHGAPETGQYDTGEEHVPPPARERPRSRPKDPRHVRAVPTTAEVKIDRALELFNGSGQQRTIAGLARTLGPAWVSARPDPAQASAVSLLVAWELAWYRYRIDLGDEGDPVEMLDKGEELAQIDESLQVWNAALDGSGRVVVEGAVAGEGKGE